ncbi:MAG TPA: hypothetical protein VNU94_07775 [Acidobacteriaceae bacterium]|jgi:hypothetical protein|nr:hypothetical protein [Acidobacteriaceae bacterium]
MSGIGEQTGGKSPGELAAEAFWFFAHTIISLVVYVGLLVGIQMAHPQYVSMLLATVLAFAIPGIAGFILALIWPNVIARYVWIFGLIYFSIVCVYVLDLPTGPGLCEHCGALSKLYLTLITFNHPSGLLYGSGNALGTWPALANIGYALGAKFGLKSSS